jgi:hypothetical protein
VAANTPLQVDLAPTLKTGMLLTGHFANAIDGADFHARFAAGAVIGINDRQLFWQLFARLSGMLSH